VSVADVTPRSLQQRFTGLVTGSSWPCSAYQPAGMRALPGRCEHSLSRRGLPRGGVLTFPSRTAKANSAPFAGRGIQLHCRRGTAESELSACGVRIDQRRELTSRDPERAGREERRLKLARAIALRK
jgi:hypothetical protein